MAGFCIFDSDVLLHKIKAILKRNEELNKEQESKEYDLGKYHFNPRLRQLGVGKDVQTLSPKENELLKNSSAGERQIAHIRLYLR